MKAFVLGLDHSIQEKDYEERLEAILRALCAKYDFDLIAEEWDTERKNNVETVGRKIAHSLGIQWLNIEMPDATKEKLGILTSLRLRSHPSHFDIEFGSVFAIPDTIYLPRADGLREAYWLSIIQAVQPKKSALIACGLIHAQPFAKKLRSAGFIVKAMTLCEYAWYRNRPGSKCADVEMNVRDERY